jgi:hypothetical protein
MTVESEDVDDYYYDDIFWNECFNGEQYCILQQQTKEP